MTEYGVRTSVTIPHVLLIFPYRKTPYRAFLRNQSVDKKIDRIDRTVIGHTPFNIVIFFPHGFALPARHDEVRPVPAIAFENPDIFLYLRELYYQIHNRSTEPANRGKAGSGPATGTGRRAAPQSRRTLTYLTFRHIRGRAFAGCTTCIPKSITCILKCTTSFFKCK